MQNPQTQEKPTFSHTHALVAFACARAKRFINYQFTFHFSCLNILANDRLLAGWRALEIRGHQKLLLTRVFVHAAC